MIQAGEDGGSTRVKAEKRSILNIGFPNGFDVGSKRLDQQ